MKGEILKNTAVTAFTGLLASVFSLGFLIFLGKALSPSEFGDFGVVNAIIIALSVLVMVYNAIVIRYIAYFAAKSQDEKITTFARRSLIALFLLGVSMCATIIWFAPQIEELLNIDSQRTIYLLGLFVLAQCISEGFAGLLTGLQRFGALGFARILQAAVVLVVAFALIRAGFSVDGALIGLIAGSLIVVPFSVFVLHKRFFVGGAALGNIGAWKYMALAVPVSLALGVFISSDVLLAKYYLSAEQAGAYAAAAAIGTLGFFITASIIRVMFPKVAGYYSNGKDGLPILREAFLYVLCAVGLLTLVIVFVPKLVAQTLLGPQFEVEQLLMLYAPATLFLSFIAVMVMYLLAVRRSSVLFPVVLGAIVKVLLIREFHADAFSLCLAVLCAHAVMLVVFVLMFRDTLLTALRKRREYFAYTDLLQYPQIKNSP